MLVQGWPLCAEALFHAGGKSWSSKCSRCSTRGPKPSPKSRCFARAFRRTRCIVPASGYYEWRAVEGGKQPYFISAADGAVLSIAGLWDEVRQCVWSPRRRPELDEPVKRGRVKPADGCLLHLLLGAAEQERRCARPEPAESHRVREPSGAVRRRYRSPGWTAAGPPA